jgi:hypothetical protein
VKVLDPPATRSLSTMAPPRCASRSLCPHIIVYRAPTVHPANNGVYPLKQAILIKDLDQFVQKNPAP